MEKEPVWPRKQFKRLETKSILSLKSCAKTAPLFGRGAAKKLNPELSMKVSLDDESSAD